MQVQQAKHVQQVKQVKQIRHDRQVKQVEQVRQVWQVEQDRQAEQDRLLSLWFDYGKQQGDRWRDGQRDGRTDKASYRDARTHLKTQVSMEHEIMSPNRKLSKERNASKCGKC